MCFNFTLVVVNFLRVVFVFLLSEVYIFYYLNFKFKKEQV